MRTHNAQHPCTEHTNTYYCNATYISHVCVLNLQHTVPIARRHTHNAHVHTLHTHTYHMCVHTYHTCMHIKDTYWFPAYACSSQTTPAQVGSTCSSRTLHPTCSQESCGVPGLCYSVLPSREVFGLMVSLLQNGCNQVHLKHVQ